MDLELKNLESKEPEKLHPTSQELHTDELGIKSVKVSSLKQGDYVILQGKPCRIVNLDRSRD